jgi:hypothetical protein
LPEELDCMPGALKTFFKACQTKEIRSETIDILQKSFLIVNPDPV